ncbi:MAG: hypothetical protein A2189_09230 [Paenibacillus sp. RIFOXYA1_FULL_44_5]|nr:MAG: hypothetical protein A2189_09230 [Paenibacillus sp. RIFOXYA1_FULL_44_5]
MLIVIGLIFLNNNLGYFPVIHFSDVIKYVVPGGIILLGISMLTGSSYRENRKSRSSEKASYEQAYHHSEDLSQPKWFKETYSWKDKKEDNHSSFIGDIYVGQDYWELVPTNVSIFIGDTVLDLTKATIAYGQTTINISCFIGDVKVLVPNDIELDVSVAVSSVIGDVNVFDRHESGMFRTVSIQSDQYSLAEKRIHIQMSTFIGAVQVKKVG